MENADAIRAVQDQYSQYMHDILVPTEAEVKRLFNQWREPSYWSKYTGVHSSRRPDPSPVQRVHSRIKRPESVIDKILRRPESFPDGMVPESYLKMPDALGVRVIGYFLASFPLIDKEIRTHKNLEIVKEYPPVAYLSQNVARRFGLTHIRRHDKDSGYASIHYTLRLKNSSIPPDERPCFELQVRTLVEDIWGEIEHILGYKPNKRTHFAVKKQFQILSQILAAIDEHFNFLFEELARFQEEGHIDDDGLLNAENLPAVLGEWDIRISQQEIHGLIKLLVSRGVITVRDLRATVTNNRLDIIRNSYRRHKGRAPTTFELVANLAALHQCKDDDDARARVDLQIKMQDSWTGFKREAQDNKGSTRDKEQE